MEPNKMPLKESGNDTACTKITKWEHAAIQLCLVPWTGYHLIL